MNVLITQPQFLPWVGYWHKIAKADVFVFYAGVSYEKNGHQNRVPFMGGWLTIPVSVHLGTPICEVPIKAEDVRRVGKTLKQNLLSRKCAERENVRILIEWLCEWDTMNLLDVQIMTHTLMAGILGFKTELKVDCQERQGDKHEKLAQCLSDFDLKDVTFLCGRGGRTLGYETVPGVSKVLYQTLQSIAEPDTLLARMAKEPVRQVRSYIDQIGGWDESFVGPSE